MDITKIDIFHLFYYSNYITALNDTYEGVVLTNKSMFTWLKDKNEADNTNINIVLADYKYDHINITRYETLPYI